MSEVDKQRTVAIIPARGGSKKIPRKNVLLLADKPLVAWPISLAKSIPLIDRVIVSTDDSEIAEIAKKYGAEVPFLRPNFLSEDTVPTLPVLQHALSFLESEEGYMADNVVLLYPTTPFLKKHRIEKGVELLASNKYQSVIGVRKVRGVLWKKDKITNAIEQFYPEERVNRQLFSHLYEEAGNIFFNKSSVLMKENTIVSQSRCFFIEVDEDEMIDIDTPEDLLQARERVKRNK